MATPGAYRPGRQLTEEGPVPFVRNLSAVAVVTGVSVLATPLAASAQTTTSTSSSFNPAIFLVFGVIFGVACALIANSKGRSPVLWGILGFALIPLIIILVMKRKSPPMYAGGQPMNPPPPPPPPA
jgi:peptidoglycan/LPS O-acetylase OafA/YrhL